MAGLLTVSSMMMCPHGGTIAATSSNTHVKVVSDFILRSSDTFLIAGCPFAIGLIPHPCVRVKWVATDMRSKAVNDPTLNGQSIGLCVAADEMVQGTVLITFTQPRVSGL